MTEKPMTVEEVAAALYPNSQRMQQAYIRARSISDRLPKRVAISKHAEQGLAFFARSLKEAWQ